MNDTYHDDDPSNVKKVPFTGNPKLDVPEFEGRNYGRVEDHPELAGLVKDDGLDDLYKKAAGTAPIHEMELGPHTPGMELKDDRPKRGPRLEDVGAVTRDHLAHRDARLTARHKTADEQKYQGLINGLVMAKTALDELERSVDQVSLDHNGVYNERDQMLMYVGEYVEWLEKRVARRGR